jgi:hypothetical protein
MRDAPASAPSCNFRKHRRVIHSQTGDSIEPRNFGLWLSQRCGLPFVDLTTPESKAKRMIDLLAQLSNSGRLGRVASRFLGRYCTPR